MKQKTFQAILFCLFLILLSSCSQYKFVRAKPAKHKVDRKTEQAEKHKKVRVAITEELVQKEIVEIEPQVATDDSNEKFEHYIENEFSIADEDLGLTEFQNESNDQTHFEQILPDNYKAATIDSPMVRTNLKVPKAYNNDWRDSAAKWGLAMTLIWLFGSIILGIVIASLLIGAGGGPYTATIITVVVFLLFMAFLVGLSLSIIGLASERYQYMAIISLCVYALVLLLAIIPPIIR